MGQIFLSSSISFFLRFDPPFSISFSPIFSPPISILKGLKRKRGITKKNNEKPSIYAYLHEVFSALKAFLWKVSFWFASAFRVASAVILQRFLRRKKRPCNHRFLYGYKVFNFSLYFNFFPIQSFSVHAKKFCLLG